MESLDKLMKSVGHLEKVEQKLEIHGNSLETCSNKASKESHGCLSFLLDVLLTSWDCFQHVKTLR